MCGQRTELTSWRVEQGQISGYNHTVAAKGVCCSISVRYSGKVATENIGIRNKRRLGTCSPAEMCVTD